jgi:hypothetical protein
MRIEEIVGRAQVLAEESLRHRLARRRRARQVRIKAPEQQRSQAAVRAARPESAHPVLPEQVVAGEELVRAFAGQHDAIAALAHEPRQHIKRRRGRSQQWRLGVPDHVRKHAGHVGGVATHRAVAGAERVDRRALIVRLIEFCVFELDGERAQRDVAPGRDQRRDDRRVQAAGEVAADGDVRAQSKPRRALERIAHAGDLGRFVFRPPCLDIG